MIIKVEIEGKIYNVSIKDVHSNPVLAEVDGKVYQVFPEAQGPAVIPATAVQPVAAPVAAPAAPVPSAGNGLTLNAPLPGVIVSIDVQAGQAVVQDRTRLNECATIRKFWGMLAQAPLANRVAQGPLDDETGTVGDPLALDRDAP